MSPNKNQQKQAVETIKKNVLIVTDMEGAAGLTKEEDMENGIGVKSLTMDIQTVVRAIKPYSHGIYIWDFDGDENNLNDVFGPNTYVLSHPTFDYLKSLRISKVFLVGFHAKAGTKNEFLPHTYSGADVRYFKLNGKEVGEATLFMHLFSQLGISTVFISGSYYACRELTQLGLPVEIVPVRKNSRVYPAIEVRRTISIKARKAVQNPGKIIRLKKYKVTIAFHDKIAHVFKNSNLFPQSEKKVVGTHKHFDVLYRDFVNGIFTSWGQKFKF